MSDSDKTGKSPSLADLEREIAANAQKQEAKPAAPRLNPTASPAQAPRRGGGLLGGTALLLALGAVGLSGYGYWRDYTAPPLAATDLSPLALRLNAVETEQQALRRTLDSLSQRQDALEARLSGGTAIVAREEMTIPPDRAAPVAGTADTEALADRIAALEDQQAEPVDLTPLTQRVQTLEAVSAEVIPRLTMLETRRQIGAVGEALIIAVGQLQAALTAGRPYGRELRAAQALAANDTALLDLLAPLSVSAETGLAGDIELRERFRLLAPAVLRADRDREGAEWSERVLGRIGSLITFRRASGEVAGDSADAVLARAEAALLANDLPRAVEEMATLPAHAAGPAADWLSLAEARMAAEAAAATLADMSLARMAGPGKPHAGNGAPTGPQNGTGDRASDGENR